MQWSDALLSLSREIWWIGLVVFIRIGAMMAVLPAFGDQTISVRVRLALIGVFSLVVAPGVADEIGARPETALLIMKGLGIETLSGLFCGLFLRFFILALQIAGSIAAQSTSLSQIFGGTAGVDPQPAISHLLVVAGTALAAMSGLHIQAANYMVLSYEIFPFGRVLDASTIAEIGVNEVGRAFGLGFILSAPFLVASLIYNLVLGVINRAMPQLMVSFVGAPAITAGGLALLLITAPIILNIWMSSFSNFMGSPFEDWR